MSTPSASMDQDASISVEALLDLTFLTEEEQNAIMEVLQRDLQLQMLEEARIRKLRSSVSDPNCLKTLSGEWFQDVRSKRHQKNHFGADVVRASIRRKKKPKADGWQLKRQGNLRDLEVISEPNPEEEDMADGFSAETTTPQSSCLTETPVKEATLTSEEAVPSPEVTAENALERSSSFSSLSSGTEEGQERQPDSDLAIEAPVQNNKGLENGQGAALVSWPAKNNPINAQNKFLSASSSFSSLSSSTMSGSLMSMLSDSVDVRGCIQFSLQYDASKKELHVQIIQCRDLAEAKKQRSDPYVKTYLLPDKSNQSKRKTAVRKRSLDPIFNEILKYKVEKAELQGRILSLSVWHHDALSRNLFMGEVEIPLNTWDWSNTNPKWFNLQPKSPVVPDTVPHRGELNLAIKFIPAGSEERGLPPTGELHIWVKNAQNLVPRWGNTIDTFVQCYILPDDTKMSRQKTRIVKKNLNPTFNHTMVYDGFEAKDLAEACAEFTVWHQETFSKNQIGGIRLSLGTGNSYGLPVPWMDSTEEERHAWEMVFKHPCQWVEGTFPLRTNLSPRMAT